MVDPNRKINRLSELLNFVEECEQEFVQRYTTDDTEFMEQCSQPESKPPIIVNWTSSGGASGSGKNGGNNGGNNRYYGAQRRFGDRNWQRRGGSAGYNNNNYRYRNNRSEPYQLRDRGRGGRDRFSERPHSHRQQSEPQHSDSTMKVRRDYGNFVPASKEE